tara:strand:+ start:827 stop:1978 length:1152 start_codon:yes stop_codon:yes gene_type:complete
MGAFCTPSYEALPTASKTVSGTDIPEWMSQAGQDIFRTAAEYAQQNIEGNFPLFDQDRMANYGDGNLMTPAEQQAQQILMEGATSYQPFMDEASRIAGTLGQGYAGMTRQELLGDPYQGATREELLGTSNQELLGDPFTLETAQPFLDIYQGAVDPAVRQLQDQILQQQSQARATAARGGGGFGSRLGIMEATLGAEGAQRQADLRARAAQEGLGFAASRFDADRSARLQAADADRAGRFQAEDVMRSQYDRDRGARFDAETAAQRQFETEEGARLNQLGAYQSLAPQIQSLQAQVAQGLMTTGEAQRRLDQQAVDLAFADYLDQRQMPMEMVNFALGALQGVPYSTRNYSLTTGQQFQQQPSVYGQTLAGVGSLASLYNLGR